VLSNAMLSFTSATIVYMRDVVAGRVHEDGKELVWEYLGTLT